MSAFRLGEDLHGGWFRSLFASQNPAGLGRAIGIFVLLFVLNLALQLGLTVVILKGVLGGEFSDFALLAKANVLAIFPASIPLAVCAIFLAPSRGATAGEVLSLRWPRFGVLGWVLVIGGFLVFMAAFMVVVTTAFGIDLSQYDPSSNNPLSPVNPKRVVEQVMFELSGDKTLFLYSLLSVGIGAPVAEEFIFRGQIFTALSKTRLGFIGTAVVTSAGWASLHFSEPLIFLGTIFIMGLVFSWMLYRFGSLWVTLACHCVWNLTQAFLIQTQLSP